MSLDVSEYDLVPDVDMPAEFVERMNATTSQPFKSLRAEMSRRRFLKLTGLAGGGLVLAFNLGRGNAAAAESTGDADEFSPNAYIQIKLDGSVIIAAPNPEVGQGVKTSLPMIVAEELDVPWASVTVRQSEISKEKYGRQVAGGSQSTPVGWNPLRQAGAVARTMLVSAAANTWGVEPSECVADQGFVVHRENGKKLAYADLVAKAATLKVPDGKSVTLKNRSEYKLLGKFIPGVDNLAIVTGQPLFGIDQQMPDLVYAVYVKCPSFRGKVKRANLDEVKRLPGVTDAFIVDGNGVFNGLMPGVAIVAKSTFEAFQAEKSLQVTWDKSNASAESWGEAKENARSLTSEAGQVLKENGNMDEAIANADKVVDAFYTYPFLSHATLEPQNCTAWFRDGKIEVWAPTQTPQAVSGLLSGILGIAPKDVTVHQLRIGGGFGRRLDNDYACEVAAIAKQVKTPVKLLWTREADMTHDFYRVGGFHNLKGTLNSDGKLTGLQDRTMLFTSPDGDGKTPVRGGGIRAPQIQCPSVPNLRLEAANLPSKIPTGWWRAPSSCSLAWVFQSFVHEMAVTAGRDHLEFLREQLGDPLSTIETNANALNTARAIDVINLVAEKGGWGKAMDAGRGRGLAFYFSHKGYFAEIAEVTVDASKNVKVDRVVVAADVGLLLNKSGGENQVEGSVVDAMSALAAQEITYEEGAVRETNFDSYPLLRMPALPQIEIHWLTTDFPPTGLGEPAFPPLAPAVTNAIFDATGTRIRTMPISKDGFKIV